MNQQDRGTVRGRHAVTDRVEELRQRAEASEASPAELAELAERLRPQPVRRRRYFGAKRRSA